MWKRIADPEVEECECGVEEGQQHVFGCRWEHCPFCEAHFVEGCGCSYLYLGLKSRGNRPEYDHLPEETYKKGLTPEQESRWFALCAERGRIPFVSAPQLCARCGQQWPEFFSVQDRVWGYYMTPDLRRAIVCLPCFQHIKYQVDKFNKRPDWLPSDDEIKAYMVAWSSGDKVKLKELEPEKFARY